MPLIWRYLLKNYFQVFFLCVTGFVSVLLVTRFQEIAKFAAASMSLKSVALFIMYQIPYILPLAVPISCLIASMLLFQKLSHSHELTAFRSCGMGLTAIVYPLILAGTILSFANFTVSSEIAPYCRGLSSQLVHELVAKNPLVMIQKDTVIKLRGAYGDMKSLKEGEKAKDVLLITKNKSEGRLGLMTAKELSIKGELLYGKDVSFISSVDPHQQSGYDHLIVENQHTMNTKASSLSEHIQTAGWLKKSEYLPLKLLIAKKLIEQKGYIETNRYAIVEIAKRITLGLAAFTFTMIGVSFGVEIGRQRRKKGTMYALALAAFFMICFVSTKSLKNLPTAAVLAYLLPHPIILLFCLRNMRKVSKGLE